jgi:sugar lactone lactonase YvrE
MLTGCRATCHPSFALMRFRSFLLISAIASLPALHAQTVSFLGNQAVLANSFSGPQGTAVDSSGDLFVVDTGNMRIVEIAPGASADCSTGCTTVASGFTNPIGIALDTSGNLYVTDSTAGKLVKVSSAGTKTTVASLTAPSGLAVDGSGNSYVALGAGSLVKVTSAGVVTSIVSGLNQPAGVAIDTSGNLYVADSGNNQVVKITSGGVQSTVVSGLNRPFGVAVDAAGTLYIGDSSNNRVVSVPAGTATANCSSGCTALGSGLSDPLGLSVDASGDVYLATGNQAVEIAADVDFGSTNVASATPASKTLTWQLPGSDCSAASSVSVLTKGAAARDFAYSAAANVCTPGSPTTFSVTVNFTPLFAGLRTGSVELTDASGNVQAVTYLHGMGIGPQVTWTPGVLSKATP